MLCLCRNFTAPPKKNHLAILRLFKFTNLARRTIIRSMLNFSSFLLVATTARKAKPLNHLAILCLDSLRSNLKSNLAKFVNLASNFPRRDPYLENVKFKFATLCVSKAASPPLTLASLRSLPSLRSAKAACKQEETASLVTRRQQGAPTKKSVVGGGGLKGVGSSFASALPRNC